MSECVRGGGGGTHKFYIWITIRIRGAVAEVRTYVRKIRRMYKMQTRRSAELWSIPRFFACLLALMTCSDSHRRPGARKFWIFLRMCAPTNPPSLYPCLRFCGWQLVQVCIKYLCQVPVDLWYMYHKKVSCGKMRGLLLWCHTHYRYTDNLWVRILGWWYYHARTEIDCDFGFMVTTYKDCNWCHLLGGPS